MGWFCKEEPEKENPPKERTPRHYDHFKRIEERTTSLFLRRFDVHYIFKGLYGEFTPIYATLVLTNDNEWRWFHTGKIAKGETFRELEGLIWRLDNGFLETTCGV